jgi:DNA gyrase subunit A
MRVCIELRKGVNTDVILNQLYKHTQMQSSFGVINLVLVDNRPLVLNLKQMMEHYVNHCRDVIRRRTVFQLRKAEEKAHILEGLTIALDNLDAVIELIKSAKDPNEAKQGLMDTFMLSEKQSQAILEMRLQRLTGLERDKIVAEYHDTLALIQKLKGILESDDKVREIIKEELVEIKNRFGDARRTQITRSSAEKLNIEDLMQEEDIIITLTKNGYVKRMSPSVFRQISRGSKGSNVMGVKEEDVVEHMFLATTHSYLLVFTSIGKVHWIKGYQIPEGGRQASGRAMVNLLQFEENESLTAIMPIKKFDDIRRVFMVTRRGISKMVMLSAFARPLARGIIALKLDEGDELIAVKPILGGEQVVIATRNGYAIRFPESEVRVMGRSARGVKAITFRDPSDEVIGMEVFSQLKEDGEMHVAVVPSANGEITVAAEAETEESVEEIVDEIAEDEVIEENVDDENSVPPEDTGRYEGKLLTVSAQGFGKKTDINNYRVTHRGGKGVINLKIMEKTGEVLAIKRMFEGDELMVVTTNGKVVRLSADSIRNTGRAASGVKLITLDGDDRLISVVRIPSQEEQAD